MRSVPWLAQGFLSKLQASFELVESEKGARLYMHPVLLAVCCVLSGFVHSASGTPLADASVVLRGATTVTSTTSAAGVFTAPAPPGDYQLTATLKGYGTASVDVKVDRDSKIDVALEPLDAPTLRTIATVTVDGRVAPQRGTIPSITLTRSDYARLGDARVIDALARVPSVTFSHPDGGQSNAIAVVSLRGPDPSETLVALDGQLLNDANTGDVDLSRFPIAAFSAVDVTEGLGPQDSEGSNTIGGAVNLVSLRPTKDRHFALSASTGSFGKNEQWANATGSHGRLGYAFAADNQHQSGYVNEVEPVYQPGLPPGCPANCPNDTLLGSSVAAHTALANLSWTFSQKAAVSARVFTLADVRDQSSAINGIDGNAGDPAYGSFVGPGAQTLAQNIRAYQLRGRAPLGAGELVAETSADDDDINIDGGVSSPMYDVVHNDKRFNEALSWQRSFENTHYALGGYTRYESFRFVDPLGGEPSVGQNIASYFARGGWQATKELDVEGAVYASHYSTFGSNLDGRIGAVLNVDPATAVRFSAGTGFRAPLLIERYIFPVAALTRDANGVYVGQGNASESPEHATEYELGFSHRYSEDATLDVSLYRTNLRDPIENYYPLADVANGTCIGPTNTPPLVNPACFSYPVNIGNVVYEGAELRFVQRFAPQGFFLTAQYGLNAAYPQNFGATISNPTSGGNLVNGQQFLGIPQQQGSLELDWAKNKLHAAVAAAFRGNNNELNQGPISWVNAAFGVKLDPVTDVTLSGTNLFNDGAGRFTVFGGGVPYRGVVAQDPVTGAPVYGPLPTDKLVVEPFALNLTVTIRT